MTPPKVPTTPGQLLARSAAFMLGALVGAGLVSIYDIYANQFLFLPAVVSVGPGHFPPPNFLKPYMEKLSRAMAIVTGVGSWFYMLSLAILFRLRSDFRPRFRALFDSLFGLGFILSFYILRYVYIKFLPYHLLIDGGVLCLLAVLFARLSVRRLIPPGHCQSCGYDLHGLTEPRCPECGTAFPPTDTARPSP